MRNTVYRIKAVRNRLVSWQFEKRPAVAIDRIDLTPNSWNGRAIAIVIAFNKPWAIDYMIRLWERFSEDCELVVVDNSSDREARQEIRQLCKQAGIGYVGLPRNFEWSPNRNHGIAINWTLRNILMLTNPDVFLVLDHDMFPLRPFSVRGHTSNQPYYGYLWPDAAIWNLWVGFATFDWRQLRNYTMNFNHNPRLGLDTGGMNWADIYSRFGRSGMSFCTIRYAVLEDETGEKLPVSVFDEQFVHISGLGHRFDETTSARARLVRTVLDQALNSQASSLIMPRS